MRAAFVLSIFGLGLAIGCNSSSLEPGTEGSSEAGTFTTTDSGAVGASDSTAPGAGDSSTVTQPDSGPLPLVVRTYTSSAVGTIDIQVNSHLVEGPTESLLVDGQLLASDAQAVVALVKQSGRELKTIVLTHAHPDHYAGVSLILAAFPNAQFVATPDVLADFNASAPGTFSYLQSVLGNLLASSLATPTALIGDGITINGQRITLVPLGVGESAHVGALALPSGGLLAGDVLYNDVHLFLGECHSAEWTQNLETIKGMGFSTFYPGHGKSPIDANVLAADEAYIAGAVPILRAAAGTDAGTGDAGDQRIGFATQELQQAFPAFKSNYLAGYSATTFIDTRACP